jgi:hypothetical protein
VRANGGVSVLGTDVVGIDGDIGKRWRLRQRSAVRTAELQLAVGQSLDLEALLVNRAMMPTTQQGEVGERGGAAVRPVTDVVALRERQSTAWKAASAVPMVQRPA